MKKIYSSLIVTMFCLSSWAQTPTFFNNNTAVGANAFPWGNPNRKIQWRILANSLGSVSGGNNISVMYFQTGTNATNTYPVLTIGLKTRCYSVCRWWYLGNGGLLMYTPEIM